MIINLNFVVAALGCLVLAACWIIYSQSGKRGLALTLCGCGVIIGVTLASTYPTRLLNLAGILVALCVLGLLALSVSMLSHARRQRGPRYYAPAELNGRCSACGVSDQLKHYKQGWLCAACAHRKGTQAA
jgi:hypothetical protein